jgi:hypothetical protein
MKFGNIDKRLFFCNVLTFLQISRPYLPHFCTHPRATPLNKGIPSDSKLRMRATARSENLELREN